MSPSELFGVGLDTILQRGGAREGPHACRVLAARIGASSSQKSLFLVRTIREGLQSDSRCASPLQQFLFRGSCLVSNCYKAPCARFARGSNPTPLDSSCVSHFLSMSISYIPPDLKVIRG